MAGVKDNLIAARALIDTPEKWADVGSVGATKQPPFGEIWSGDLWRALNAQSETPDPLLDKSLNYPDIMALFDRAIAAAEVAA